jgi:hypothetical protein
LDSCQTEETKKKTGMLLLAGALLATLTHHALGFTDTEHWVGAEYTPAAAPGNGYVRARRHSRHTPRLTPRPAHAAAFSITGRPFPSLSHRIPRKLGVFANAVVGMVR